MLEVKGEFSLHDDDAVREKLTVMSKWDAMVDDGRNDQPVDFEAEINGALELGKRYEVVIVIREIGPA